MGGSAAATSAPARTSLYMPSAGTGWGLSSVTSFHRWLLINIPIAEFQWGPDALCMDMRRARLCNNSQPLQQSCL